MYKEDFALCNPTRVDMPKANKPTKQPINEISVVFESREETKRKIT